GKPALTQTVAPAGIPAAETIGKPITAQPSLTTLLPTGIPSTETVGAPTVTGIFLKPAGVPSAETPGIPKIANNACPTGIASAGTVGPPTIAVFTAPKVDAVGAGNAAPPGNGTNSWSHTAAAGS